MGTGENLKDKEVKSLNLWANELRQKLWKENKIRLNGYTYSEWKAGLRNE